MAGLADGPHQMTYRSGEAEVGAAQSMATGPGKATQVRLRARPTFPSVVRGELSG